jgi:hypothetical protein
MYIVELISTGDGQIMETLDSVGIKLFVLAALKEYYLYLSLFFCLFLLYITSVSALQIVFSNSLYESDAKWETAQIVKEDRLLVCV